MEAVCEMPVSLHGPQAKGSSLLSEQAGALQGLLMSNLPLSQDKQQQVEELIKQCTQAELEQLGLGAPARPVIPKNIHRLDPFQRLQAIQRVISSLHYNHAPGYMYNVSKDRPYNVILNTAREVLRDALPIKCVEAVFLGLLLTSDWLELDRFPVGFKSKCAGNTYRHIVLAVRHVPTNTWGALGISRRNELQYKPLGALTLADLMADYQASYEMWGHTLYKIRVGLPVEHDSEYTGAVCWRYTNISCGRHPWGKCRAVLNAFSENSRMLANRFKVLGFRPPSRSGADASNAPASRVALSGTTPQPGASRPPLPSIPPQPRHASISPSKRKPQARMPASNKGKESCPDRARSTTSAPPRQRPVPPSTSRPSLQHRPSLPLLPRTSGRTDKMQPPPLAKTRSLNVGSQATSDQVVSTPKAVGDESDQPGLLEQEPFMLKQNDMDVCLADELQGSDDDDSGEDEQEGDIL